MRGLCIQFTAELEMEMEWEKSAFPFFDNNKMQYSARFGVLRARFAAEFGMAISFRN